MSVPVIDGYSDIEQVARGGFGIVYRARREHLDQDVALKVLALADLSERDRERFQREARAAGNLSWHPHVVAVYDSGITADGHPYLAMEYLDAGTFADRLTTGPMPWQDVVVVGIQVAGALGAAHTAGTLHRDLKPENILVGPFGEALLGDFGIAAVEGGTRTATGHASYTVTHVAPEILRGQRPDERSDLYGLASTLFTLLTGRTPFAGDDPDEPIATIITRALTEPAPHLTGIPEPLADLLQRTLDKDPDHRPQTAQSFGEALQQIQRGHGLTVTDLRLGRQPASRPVADVGASSPASGAGDSQRTIHVTSPSAHTGDLTVGPATAAGEVTPPPPPPPPPPTRTPFPPPPTPPSAAKKRLNPVMVIGLGVVALLTIVAVAVSALGGDQGGGDSPTPTTGPAAALDTLFVDDLSEDANGWGEVDVDELTASFTSDGYEIDVEGEPSLFGYPDAGPGTLIDSSTSVQIDRVSPTMQGGVTCRLTKTGPTEYYTLTANPDSGDFAIIRVDRSDPSGGMVMLAEGTDPDLVGDDVTDLTGTCMGEGDGSPVELSLSVNGDIVATATDNAGLGPGISGIAIFAPDRAGSVTFTDYEVAGEEGPTAVDFEDDFSDPASGFPDDAAQAGNRANYSDGAYTIQSRDRIFVDLPIRSPVNDSGTVSVTLDGDLTGVFAGLCLSGPGGDYEFVVSGDGGGSIRHLAPGATESTVVERVAGVFTTGAPVRISAGWNTDGNSSNIDLFVDGDRVVSASDDAVTSYTSLSLCGSVNPSAASGTTLEITYDDIAFVGDP